MTTATQLVQHAYSAFDRNDIPELLSMFADKLDCGDFFVALADPDKPHQFAPRKFIESDNRVTVVGQEETVVLENGQRLTNECLHLFTIENNKILHWNNFYSTAAQHGIVIRTGGWTCVFTPDSGEYTGPSAIQCSHFSPATGHCSPSPASPLLAHKYNQTALYSGLAPLSGLG